MNDDLSKDIEKILKECFHKEDAPKFSNDDLNICKPSKQVEGPEPFEINIEKIKTDLYNSMQIESNESELSICINSLTNGVETLKQLFSYYQSLLEKVNTVRERYWVYNLVYEYYQTKSEIYSQYFNQFTPLVKRKEKIEKEIEALKIKKADATINTTGTEAEKAEQNKIINLLEQKEKSLKTVLLNIQKVRNQDAILVPNDPQVNLDSIKEDINSAISIWSDLVKAEKQGLFGSDSDKFTLNFKIQFGKVLFGTLKQYYDLETRVPSEDERKDTNYIDKRNKYLDEFLTNTVILSYNNALDVIKTVAKDVSLYNIIQEKNWERITDQQADIKDVLATEAKQFEKNHFESEAEWIKLQDDLIETKKHIDLEVKRISEIKCFQTLDSSDSTIPEGTEVDDNGNIISFNIANSTYPTMTKLSYWRKFCQYATIVGLLPIYWATGLLIPGPNGIIPIPFPIFFTPLAVIPTPIGLFVFIIGQRGILPCPILFYINPGFESKFIIGLRSSNLPVFSRPGEPPASKLLPGMEDVLFGAIPPITDSIKGADVIGDGAKTPTIPNIPIPTPFDKIVNKVFSPVIGNKTKEDPNKLLQQFPSPYIQDDLPPWERLTLKNIPWKLYLNSWCLQAKVNSGFPGWP